MVGGWWIDWWVGGKRISSNSVCRYIRKKSAVQ
jgi:hypothetical protein